MGNGLRDLPPHALAPHAAETIAELKAAGRQVILLTSGVPDPFVKDLAAALGADAARGRSSR